MGWRILREARSKSNKIKNRLPHILRENNNLMVTRCCLAVIRNRDFDNTRRVHNNNIITLIKVMKRIVY